MMVDSGRRRGPLVAQSDRLKDLLDKCRELRCWKRYAFAHSSSRLLGRFPQIPLPLIASRLRSMSVSQAAYRRLSSASSISQ